MVDTTGRGCFRPRGSACVTAPSGPLPSAFFLHFKVRSSVRKRGDFELQVCVFLCVVKGRVVGEAEEEEEGVWEVAQLQTPIH